MRKLVIVGLVFFLGYFTSYSQDDVDGKVTVKSNPNRTIKIVKVKENIYLKVYYKRLVKSKMLLLKKSWLNLK